MQTALKWFLLAALVLTALATVVLLGLLHGYASQDVVRLIVDGQEVLDLRMVRALNNVTLAAGIALVLLLVFLIVPPVLALALVLSAAAGALCLAAAMSPLLLMGALAWWIIRRSKTLRPAKE